MMSARRALLVSVGAALTAFSAVCASSPSGRELPESEPFPPDLEERLHAVRDAVAELRGMPVNPDVREGTITRDQLRVYYDEIDVDMTDDERREYEASNTAMRLLRMIGPEEDLLEEFSESSAEDILGFYVPDEDELVFVGDPSQMTPGDEYILAHEYIHSFVDGAVDEDAISDLIEEENDEEDARTEYSTTASCVEEGDASLSGLLYAQQTYGDAFFESGGEGEPPASEPESQTPPAIERYQMFDYNECVTFVAAMYWENESWGAVDRLYRELPTTTEQILHPEKYQTREGTTPMRRPDLSEQLGEHWELWWGGMFGEFDVYNYLATITEDEAGAGIAAAGWGVGWMSIYSTEADEETTSDVVVHIALEFDSMDEFNEFGAFYGYVLTMLAADSYTAGDGVRPVCWDAPDEFGYVTFSDNQPRFDIVIATTADARTAAVSGDLASGPGTPCAPSVPS